ADRPGFHCAMDAVDRVLAVLMDVEGASTQRILDAGSHAAIGNAVGLELGLTRDHFIRRGPTGPLALIGDHGTTSPGVTVLAHADAAARGTSAGQHAIEVAVRCVDDPGADLLVGHVVHFRAPVGRIE